MKGLKDELEAITEAARDRLPPGTVDILRAANARLAAGGLAGRALARGERAPDFVLPDAAGHPVDSRALREQGPLVISFYRGAWCPYCNLELRALQARLGALAERGASLVAISPQTPDASLTQQEKLALEFPVLFDRGNAVARRFGLVFQLDSEVRPIYEALGVDLEAVNGDGSFELPVPATYLIGADGRVIGRFVDPEYSRRLDPDVVLEWLDRVSMEGWQGPA